MGISGYERLASLVAAALLVAVFMAGRWSAGGAWPFNAAANASVTAGSGRVADAEPADPVMDSGRAASPGLAQGRMPLGSYRAQVLRIIDGDTVEVRVPVWLGQELVTKVRLRGIDAPEIRGACGSEREQALKARDRLEALVAGKPVWLTEIGPDKYHGRVVARLMTGEESRPVDAGAALLREGHARAYDGKARMGWCALAGG
jgi:micrococcal nuclease